MVEPKIRVGIHTGDSAVIKCLRGGITEIRDVRFGVGFHWDQLATLCYEGEMAKYDGSEPGIGFVNTLGLEEYIKSVIASEMNPLAHPELLKAHAVISRSWALRRIRTLNLPESRYDLAQDNIQESGEAENMRWYDDSAHCDFDVCSDDHCQRYQGLPGEWGEAARAAVEATGGIAICDADGAVCDARFSKCCGGVTEEFEACWQSRHYSYLETVVDAEDNFDIPDLQTERGMTMWVAATPECYCNVKDKHLLKTQLKEYDIATTPDFFRWTHMYTRQDLGKLILRKSGLDLGSVQKLEPLSRGKSGRIWRLKIIGSKGEAIIGKELEIRRILSETHLPSSAFVVGYDNDNIIIKGAGWGHGVGLCQIGAAAMAVKGADYKEILAHYYPGSKLQKLYQ